ncbi:hypothetical protein [Kitasatospora phosalacinea]|uniref:Uncharacterized protein n=1 Tax=Kitasatospora phosalacinea TaxID=2065 RepID=A0A9W6PQN3_9ACTN|nr:hypothetical protein [Kitasatospora phosalacinea]GLW59376.1 hypothetical protein Kpho01_73860 [Kitasatospora phosalacinea]
MTDLPYPPRTADGPQDEGQWNDDLGNRLPPWVNAAQHQRPERPAASLEAAPGSPPAPMPLLEAPPAETVPALPAVQEVAPGVLSGTVPTNHFHGPVDVAAGVIEQLIIETRKRDLLEGEEVNRAALLEQPFVRDAWVGAWREALDPVTKRLRVPVLIVLAPRSIGSTTFALRLLAEGTSPDTTLVKLQADWSKPLRSKFPLERRHAFQLDLKDPRTDRVSAEFLNTLVKHADDLAKCGSHLVLTVAQEVWDALAPASRAGLQVLRLTESPAAEMVVDAHLVAEGHHEPAERIRKLDQAQSRLHGLNAVAAVRAAHRIVAAWQEAQLPLLLQNKTDRSAPKTFEDRALGALSDWRGELDELFGDRTAVGDKADPSLAVEDRYLLLSLAVRQSAPVSLVSAGARKLQEAVELSNDGTAASTAQSAFAGRGLRRRIQDVGATVDGHDKVLFDRPAYGQAVLEYVWDNYETMRTPLLSWLASLAGQPDPADPALRALASLALRHGTGDHLNELSKLVAPDLLGAVLRTAVLDEHVGRLVWSVLYHWAGQVGNAPTVVSTCRLVLADSEVGSAAAKMAVVRLRRVARTTSDPVVRENVLAAFDELAGQPAGRSRLLAEVRAWQSGKATPESGGLAFLALMSVHSQGLPWLLSQEAAEIDAQQALAHLLSGSETGVRVIPRITDWIHASADERENYEQLRDQLLVPLRGHRMLQAGMNLMKALAGSATAQGVNIAEDFYEHLVASPIRSVFPLEDAAR